MRETVHKYFRLSRILCRIAPLKDNTCMHFSKLLCVKMHDFCVNVIPDIVVGFFSLALTVYKTLKVLKCIGTTNQ